MGTGKKEATRKERQGKNDGMGNVRVKGENFYRDAKKVKTLNRLTKVSIATAACMRLANLGSGYCTTQRER